MLGSRSGRRVAVLTALAVAAGLATAGLGAAQGRAAGAPPLAIAIVGNHFVDGAGAPLVLHGVNRPGGEYQCVQSNGYTPAQGSEDSDAAAIAAWHADVVRIPLNEDCWLGLNGEPSGGMTSAGYRAAVTTYVDALHRHGLYAILDLHWSAPATTVADGQRALPDDHTAAFWSSVAGTFVKDPAVLFDLFNEPAATSGYPVSWDCWRNGGCTLPDVSLGGAPVAGQTYAAVGMQALVTAVRAAGATQPILLGGLSYADDLSGWLGAEPADPLRTPQLAASFHTYDSNACSAQSCWDSTIAPLAAQVPVLDGEFGQSPCGTNGDDPAGFDSRWMAWADAHGLGYLAWGWFTPTPDCSAFILVSDATGTPAQPNGVALHDHLAALAAAQPAPSPSLSTAASTAASTGASAGPTPGTVPTVAASRTAVPGGVPTLPGTPAAPSVVPATSIAPAAPGVPNVPNVPTVAPPSLPGPAVLAGLRLRFTGAGRRGDRLTLRLTATPGFTGHVGVTTTLLVHGVRRTLHSTFVVTLGTTVAVPHGARILTVVVDHPAGYGFAATSVTELGSSVHPLPPHP